MTHAPEQPDSLSIENEQDGLTESLRQMISPPMRVYRDVIMASIFINLFTLCLPLITMSVYQKVLPASAMATLVALCIAVLFIIVFDWMFNKFRMQRILAVQTDTDRKVARAIYRRLADAALDGRVLNGSALMSTVRDFDQARSALASGIIGVMVDLPFLVIFILLLLTVNVYIGAVAMIGVVIIMLSGVHNMNSTLRYHALVGKASTARHTVLLETIRDFIQTRTSGWLPQLTQKHDQTTEDLTLANSHMNFSSQSSAILTKTLVQAVQTLTTLAGAWAVIQGDLSMAALIGFSMLAARTAGIAGQIAAILPRWAMAKKSLANVEQALAMPQRRKSGQSYTTDIPPRADIAFDDVSFAYPDMPVPALQDVTFSLPAGKVLVLMGASGSGKTTLLNLVMGIFPPTQGHVRYGQVGLSYLDPDLYCTVYSGIAAEPILYGETLAQWFSAGMPSGSLEQAEQILGDLGFSSLIKDHPRGIYRPLEAGGQGFSVGQKKIVALIRALLSPSKLIVMDEPTESMDKEIRLKIVDLIGKLARDRTMIIASHDDAVLKLADYIGILGGGRLLIFDTAHTVQNKMQAR